MKPRFPASLAGLMCAAAIATRAAESTPPTAVPPAKPATPAAAKAKPESRVRREADGNIVITLDLPTQKVMGLQTAPLETARLAPETKGYGRVLDASTLITATAELVSAQAAARASNAEWDRLKKLAGQSNASERALQAAEAAAVRDQAQADSARLRLLAAWGAGVANREDLPALVRSLAGLDSALVELDLPAGTSVPATPTGARLLTLADEAKPITAQVIGPAPTVDPLGQGRGFLLLVSPNPTRLAPGQAVTGLLGFSGEAAAGFALPRPAIVRHNGATWVYLQTGETTFERKEVVLEHPLAEAWFVRESLKPGDQVVVTGAQQVLSEELKGSDEASGKED